MLTLHPIASIARRIGLDRGRAVANANPNPGRRVQDRHEQHEAIRERRRTAIR